MESKVTLKFFFRADPKNDLIRDLKTVISDPNHEFCDLLIRVHNFMIKTQYEWMNEWMNEWM